MWRAVSGLGEGFQKLIRSDGGERTLTRRGESYAQGPSSKPGTQVAVRPWLSPRSRKASEAGRCADRDGPGRVPDGAHACGVRVAISIGVGNAHAISIGLGNAHASITQGVGRV